ncbi:MAG: metal-dependent transcriptional regulator [Clostridia bacterium]|nr:metal-dependent transcriptional regulator [Clostridia bacterium]
MNIHESGEMYLENIYVLRKQMSEVRSIDIVNHTGYSKPSISRAIGLLKEEGLILVDKKGYITLTETGEARAKKIYERHEMLTEFFVSIGVSEETASADACKIEHVISDETFEAIKRHANIE